jgi:DNA-binding MarR family transcriptional regulator
MSLKQDLGLTRGFTSREHEGILSIFYTGELIRKRAREFFSEFGLTEVQFNLLELLYYQAEEGRGITQAELSRMILVNKSNMTGLIDRMEKNNLVKRTAVPGDRRYNEVRLTSHGKRMLNKVEDKYIKEISSIMKSLKPKELMALIGSLDKVRKELT